LAGTLAAVMGQPIVVTEVPGLHHGTVRFELNRSLTGMGHERYRAGDPVEGDRPADELARRFFATGQVTAMHAYMSVVTATLADGSTSEGLKELVEDLYRFYPDQLGADPPPSPPGPNPELGPATPAEASPPAH
jgi:hypothetical protein